MSFSGRYLGLFLLTLLCTVALGSVDARAAIINVPTDYTTIQAAIDAASPGDTIAVAPGTYAGNINVTKSVTILGDPGDSAPGPGPNAPLIDGGSAPGSGFFIADGVHDVTISGFEIANFTSNSNGIGNGISAWQTTSAGTSNITITDNYFHNLGWDGVLIGNDGAKADNTNWTIKNNILETYALYGFEFTNTSNSTIENNIIHSSNAVTCILVVARRNESGIVIKGNKLTGVMYPGYPAIYVLGWDLETPNVNLNDILIQNNTISTTSPTSTAQIYLHNVGTGTITDAQVHGNSLKTLTTNTPATVDATNNWWGTLNPSVMASRITGNVIYIPYLTSPPGSGIPVGYSPAWLIITLVLLLMAGLLLLRRRRVDLVRPIN